MTPKDDQIQDLESSYLIWHLEILKNYTQFSQNPRASDTKDRGKSSRDRLVKGWIKEKEGRNMERIKELKEIWDSREFREQNLRSLERLQTTLNSTEQGRDATLTRRVNYDVFCFFFSYFFFVFFFFRLITTFFVSYFFFFFSFFLSFFFLRKLKRKWHTPYLYWYYATPPVLKYLVTRVVLIFFVLLHEKKRFISTKEDIANNSWRIINGHILLFFQSCYYNLLQYPILKFFKEKLKFE